jgi:exopolyphosphatase/guanosine-5'-triphosphate,3'-diphosphate pyrophosphatase
VAEVVPIRGRRARRVEVDPAAPERVAAIDIGSNSIHMIVVEEDGHGGYRVLARERDMVRLGKSALTKGSLSPRARRDGLEALLKMTTMARLKGARQIVAVATSAVREAANGADFLAQVKATTGLAVRKLDGEEEGELIFRAVRHAVDLGRGWSVLADVGGGSTEWCVARGGELRSVRSVPLGSLRCAAWLSGDPPPARSIGKLRRAIRALLPRLKVPKRLELLVATSGTANCCGDLADHFAGREEGSASGSLRELPLEALADVVERLSALERAEIAELPAVGAQRSGSILAGAILLEELTRHTGAERLHLCDRALREGLVLEALGHPHPASGAATDVRRRQVETLALRAPSMADHARQVARLAVRLFDSTAPVHNLGEREREWLEYAALLHDVGYSIHFQRHHQHSRYLIATSNLDAFDPREIEVIAEVARYHRGARPKLAHEGFAALEAWQRRAVRALAALLRIANALDRTHAARVEELRVSLVKRKRIVIEILARLDVSLELTAARHRARLFERVFGRRVELRQGRLRRPKASVTES